MTKNIKITWLGHSAVKLSGSKNILIDPFFLATPPEAKAAAIENIDIIAVTHAHADHLGEAYELCKSTGATLVGIAEIADEAAALGIKAEGMNIGGKIVVEGVSISMVFACHSARIGNPAGYVIELDGKRIYHAGDTGLTLEMKLIGELYQPELSLLPIGDRYTMGAAQAAKAVKFLQTKKAVPMHYDTFPAINADPAEFKRLVADKAEVVILEKGEALTL